VQSRRSERKAQGKLVVVYSFGLPLIEKVNNDGNLGILDVSTTGSTYTALLALMMERKVGQYLLSSTFKETVILGIVSVHCQTVTCQCRTVESDSVGTDGASQYETQFRS
jgi:hypothetical protein